MNLGHWQFLTGFYKFSFVKLFISWFAIVPVVLYLFREIPEVIIFSTAPDVYIEIQAGLPFSWTVLWVASLLFALSAALFVFFCPPFIQRHDTFEKYKEFGHSPRWVVSEVAYALNGKGRWLWNYDKTLQFRKFLVAKSLAIEVSDSDVVIPKGANATVVRKSDRTVVYFHHDDKIYEMFSKQAPPAGDERENDIFWELFEYFAKTHPFVRGLIKFLISASFILVGFIVIQNIWFALEYVIEWLIDAMSTMLA